MSKHTFSDTLREHGFEIRGIPFKFEGAPTISDTKTAETITIYGNTPSQDFLGLDKIVDTGTTVGTMYVEHTYFNSWGSDKRRHACLLFGSWCWKNAIEHPLDIVTYIRILLRFNFIRLKVKAHIKSVSGKLANEKN